MMKERFKEAYLAYEFVFHNNNKKNDDVIMTPFTIIFVEYML